MPNTSIYIPEEMVHEVDELAYEMGEPGNQIPRSEVIREAIVDYLEKHGRRHESDSGGSSKEEAEVAR